jgi:hypothetical protein
LRRWRAGSQTCPAWKGSNKQSATWLPARRTSNFGRRELDKTLLGGRRRIRYGYEIRLENLLGSQAKLTVHDQIPVARHEEIKVKLESCEPRATTQSELNLLDWELELAAKEKRTLRFDFSVEFPQAMEVGGCNKGYRQELGDYRNNVDSPICWGVMKKLSCIWGLFPLNLREDLYMGVL